MRIITPSAMSALAHPDPEYRFMAGDAYDVDHEAFTWMKKTLLRLERLIDFCCSASLWVPVPGLEGFVTLAVQNGSVHRYYRFGAEKMAAPPEMRRCLDEGQVVVAPSGPPPGALTVLAPVSDSLGDPVAVVEFSALPGGEDRLAPAWS